MYEESGIEEMAMALYFVTIYPYGANEIKPKTLWTQAGGTSRRVYRQRAALLRSALRAAQNNTRVSL
jgi:hypothetical protein